MLETYNRLQRRSREPRSRRTSSCRRRTSVARGAGRDRRARAQSPRDRADAPPILVDVNSDRTVANVAIPIAGKGNDGPSNAALAALRRDIVPETVGSVSDVEVAVGGFAAESKDFND